MRFFGSRIWKYLLIVCTRWPFSASMLNFLKNVLKNYPYITSRASCATVILVLYMYFKCVVHWDKSYKIKQCLCYAHSWCIPFLKKPVEAIRMVQHASFHLYTKASHMCHVPAFGIRCSGAPQQTIIIQTTSGENVEETVSIMWCDMTWPYDMI